ncbi:MAG: HAD hydrolase family protein [Bacteroidales bacterium]|nr:HAD hydrolase family protein [Bacteroidales bacterium]
MNLLGIKAFAFDIDGVATDGGVFCNSDGDLLRTYDAKDGFAIRMAVMNGYPVAVITGGSSESIRKRMVTSGVKPEDVFLHCRNKIEQFTEFCSRYGLRPEEVMYFGDDVPDVECIMAAGCGVSPADAVPEAIEAADWVTEHKGGRGCLREAIEGTLRAQGKWVFDPAAYKKKF